MLTCPDTQDALSARQDGELTPARLQEVDNHLAGCAACRIVATELADLDRYLLTAPPIATDPTLSARLTAELFAPPAPVIALPPPRPSWALRAAALLALTAAAALLTPREPPRQIAAPPRTSPTPPDLLRLREELSATARELQQLKQDLATFQTTAAAESRRTDQSIATKLPESWK